MKRCYMTMGQKQVMPKGDQAKMSFNNWSHMLSPPFVMYADMECLLVPPDEANGKILQTHVPCAVGSYIVPHPGLHLPDAASRIPSRRELCSRFLSVSGQEG